MSNHSNQGILCFLYDNDEVLLVHSGYRSDEKTWDGIGEFLQTTKSPELVAVKTIYDRVKVEVNLQDLEKAAVIHHRILNKDGKALDELELAVFLCNRWRGEPRVTPGIKPQWFSIDVLPFQEMPKDEQYWLPNILEGERLIVEVLSKINPETNKIDLQDVQSRSI